MRKKVRNKECENSQVNRITNILDGISDGIFALNRDWRFTYINRQAAAIVNLQPEDLLGENIWERYPQAVGTELEEKYRKCMTERSPQEFEMWGALSKVWFHVRVYPSPEGISVYWQDITEHRKAEIALKESEERFSKAFSSSPAATIISNLADGTIVDINDSFERLLGYNRQELIGQKSTDLNFYTHPEDRPELVRLLRETGRVRNRELPLRNKQGEFIFVLFSIDVISISGQSLAISTLIDITERKQAEEKLRESEERYRNLVETAGEGIVLARPEGPYYYVNQRMADMLGYSIKEILGKSSTDFTFEGWQPQVLQARKDLHKGDFIQGEFKFRRKDGSVLWSRYNASPLFNDKGEHIANLALHTDITEHKQTGEWVDFERRRLKTVLETIPVAVVIAEAPYGRFSYINRRARELYGFESSGLTLEENLAVVKPKRPDGSPYPINELPAYLALKGQTVFTKELMLEKPDGTTYPIFGSAAPILDSQGNVVAAVVIFDDITERKKAEEALSRYKDELEIMVRERTEQLQKAFDEIVQTQKDLKEANKQLKQYARQITVAQEAERKRIAYELHDDTAQYLSIVKMQVSGLLHSGKIQDQETLKKLEYLERDADRAFYDVKRYSHELRPVVLENLGLTAALEQIADDYNMLKQLHVEVNVEGIEPELSEEVKLGFFRIAQEALNNTRKHAKASGVIINLIFQENHIEISVRDNGVGFDVKESAERAGGKGSLGLISMQERSRLIGADIKIESRPGNGTMVSAVLKL